MGLTLVNTIDQIKIIECEKSFATYEKVVKFYIYASL